MEFCTSPLLFETCTPLHTLLAQIAAMLLRQLPLHGIQPVMPSPHWPPVLRTIRWLWLSWPWCSCSPLQAPQPFKTSLDAPPAPCGCILTAGLSSPAAPAGIPVLQAGCSGPLWRAAQVGWLASTGRCFAPGRVGVGQPDLHAASTASRPRLPRVASACSSPRLRTYPPGLSRHLGCNSSVPAHCCLLQRSLLHD